MLRYRRVEARIEVPQWIKEGPIELVPNRYCGQLDVEREVPPEQMQECQRLLKLERVVTDDLFPVHAQVVDGAPSIAAERLPCGRDDGAARAEGEVGDEGR